MTEQIKKAISIIENEKKCVQSDCDRDCANCKLVKEESEIVGAFDIAIRSLNAWEEVLTELEERRLNSALYETKVAYQRAIGIIKQKLAEFEE